MIQKKIKMVIKRYTLILAMLKKGKRNGYIRVRNRKVWIEIDDDMLVIVEIIDEIIEREQTEWLKKLYTKILKGEKDFRIMMDCPVERGKYYETKKRFFNKIYQCCICKGLVLYDEILNENIG